LDHERTFVIHWDRAEDPALSDPIFQSLPEIIRPRSLSVDSFRSWEAIDPWPGGISATNTFDYPTGTKSFSLLEGEVAEQRLGLTTFPPRYSDEWSRWLEHRILQARISHELVERDDSLDVLIWGETRLGLLPLRTAEEKWFLRQKVGDEFVPIVDVIVSLAGPKARLTDLLITVHSPVYSTEEQFVRMTDGDYRHLWLARFLSESVGCFDQWFRKLMRSYSTHAIRWHASGFPLLGSQLHEIFTDVLGREEERWEADAV